MIRLTILPSSSVFALVLPPSSSHVLSRLFNVYNKPNQSIHRTRCSHPRISPTCATLTKPPKALYRYIIIAQVSSTRGCAHCQKECRSYPGQKDAAGLPHPKISLVYLVDSPHQTIRFLDPFLTFSAKPKDSVRQAGPRGYIR